MIYLSIYLPIRLFNSFISASIDRPWGHGKMESLGTLCVGSLLIMTGVGVGYTGLVSAYNMTFVVDSIQVS